jgi:hypothetical protein
MKNIPTNEQDNVLSIYWQMLGQIESRTKPKEDILDKLLVKGAYNVLNRIGYTNHRPRWEDAPNESALPNVEAEARRQ